MTKKKTDPALRCNTFLLICAALFSAAFGTATAQKAKPKKKHSSQRAAVEKHQVSPAPPPTSLDTVSEQQPPVFTGGIRDNNVGVALMDAHRFSEAFSRFQTACIMVPDSDTGCLNSGIALLAMRQFVQAQKILSTSAARDAKSASAWFNLGLLARAAGQTQAALADFQRVAAIDPEDAETQCLIGLSYMAEHQYDAAFKSFQAALKIDPLNSTAESGATEALAKTGHASGSQTASASADETPDSSLLSAFGEHYGEQGTYSIAAEIPPPNIVAPPIPVQFFDVTRQSGMLLLPTIAPRRRGGARSAAKPSAPRQVQSMADFLGSGACVFDYDGDGRPDVFLVDADGNGDAALYRNVSHGRFANVTKAAKIEFRGAGMGCAAGDYDNDGHPDLAISFNGGMRLYHNNGKGAFTDITAASQIQMDGLVMGLSFIDYNRDGNLDLYATRLRNSPLANSSQPFAWPNDGAPGNVMWRNNGDGTFSDVTAALRLAGGASSTGAIATQLTDDDAVDFLLTGLSATTPMLMNGRGGAFKSASWWGAETQGPTAGAVALDFDKDGYMDVALTHWQPTTLGLWRNIAGKRFQRVAVPDPGWMRAWGIAALDYDNDGWIDLVAVGETFSGEGCIVLLRNEGGKGFHDATPETGLDKTALHDPRSVIAFDPDGTGSLDLLITQNHRPPVLLKAVGAAKHNWAQFVLRGSTQNTMGIGMRVEMISGALRQTWEVPAASGYLSQGPALISAGLADEGVDAVRVRWSKNNVQVQLRPPANRKTLLSQADTGETP
ncbi:MAG: FG-GAP-like repeat-containing protein [Candidatus Acidiferrales bacterium]